MRKESLAKKVLLGAGIFLALATTGCVTQEQEPFSPLKRVRVQVIPTSISQQYTFTADIIFSSDNDTLNTDAINQGFYGRIGPFCDNFTVTDEREHVAPETGAKVLDGISGTAVCTRFDDNSTGPQIAPGNYHNLDNPVQSIPAEWQPYTGIR